MAVQPGTGYIDGPSRTFIASQDLFQFAALQLTANEDEVKLSNVDTDPVVGVAARAVLAGQQVPVILRNKQGTIPIMMITSILAGGTPILSVPQPGKFTVGGGAVTKLGIVLQAATAADQVVEAIAVPRLP